MSIFYTLTIQYSATDQRCIIDKDLMLRFNLDTYMALFKYTSSELH